MSTLFRCAMRLIAAGALAFMLPTLATASGVEQSSALKLAMGPMSAAQKNQTPAAAENAPVVDIKPRYRIKHHHRIRHWRHHAG